MRRVTLRLLGRSLPTSQLSPRLVGPSRAPDKVLSLLKPRQEACTVRWPFPSGRFRGHSGCSAASGCGPLPAAPRAPVPVLTLRRWEAAEAMAQPGSRPALRDRGCPSPRASRQRGGLSRGEVPPPRGSLSPELKSWQPLRHGGRQHEGGAPSAFTLLWKVPGTRPGPPCRPSQAWHRSAARVEHTSLCSPLSAGSGQSALGRAGPPQPSTEAPRASRRLVSARLRPSSCCFQLEGDTRHPCPRVGAGHGCHREQLCRQHWQLPGDDVAF